MGALGRSCKSTSSFHGHSKRPLNVLWPSYCLASHSQNLTFPTQSLTISITLYPAILFWLMIGTLLSIHLAFSYTRCLVCWSLTFTTFLDMLLGTSWCGVKLSVSPLCKHNSNPDFWTHLIGPYLWSESTFKTLPMSPICMTLPYHVSEPWIWPYPPLCPPFHISFTNITFTLPYLLFPAFPLFWNPQNCGV